jgi:hypothetical protein
MFYQLGENVMKHDQKLSDDTDDQKRIQEKFESLPLNEKLSSLFNMEVATISEAVNYVINDPMKVVEKLGDMITDFGTKVEKEYRSVTSTAPSPPSGSSNKKARARRPSGPNAPSA